MFVKELVLSSVVALTLGVLDGGSQESRVTGPGVGDDYAAPPVSLIRLVARCQDFKDKMVMTAGYASFDFENFTLCPSSEISQHDPASCFWLKSDKDGIPSKRLINLKEWSKTWVSIEAKVDCSEYHHAGALKEIQFIVEHNNGRVLWSTDPALKDVIEQE